MRVKRHQKALEIYKKVPVLYQNEQKVTDFEHFLYHTVRVGNRGFRRGGFVGRDTCPVTRWVNE
jgi:predicted nucleotidyltransferase